MNGRTKMGIWWRFNNLSVITTWHWTITWLWQKLLSIQYDHRPVTKPLAHIQVRITRGQAWEAAGSCWSRIASSYKWVHFSVVFISKPYILPLDEKYLFLKKFRFLMKNVWGPFQEGLVVMAIFDPYISPLDEKLSMHFF